MRAYLDANIPIAFTVGPEKEHDTYYYSEQVFDDIDAGLYQGILTHLVLMEILNVFRLIKGREYDDIIKHKTDKDREKYVKSESDNMYQDMIVKMYKVPDKIIFQNCNAIDAGDILRYGLILLNSKFGHVETWERECINCHVKKNYSNYRGLSPLDICHIVLAHRLKCDKFITTDKSYNKLIGELDLDPLEIVIME